MQIKLDVKKYPPGHQFTVVKCEKCGVYYEPYGKGHKCKKEKIMNNIKKCKCGNPIPEFIEDNPSNIFLICKKRGQRTNGCSDKEHAVFCWNNGFVFTTH